MNATAEEIDSFLAENVCGWNWNGTFWLDGNYVVHGKAWKPTRDRNHLSEVLAKVPEKMHDKVADHIAFKSAPDQLTWSMVRPERAMWRGLTADPLTVATAIYQALNNKQETRDDE